jgi:hypothetical protein
MAPPKAEDKSERPDARILDRVLKRERRAGQAADVASLSGIDKTDRSGT